MSIVSDKQRWSNIRRAIDKIISILLGVKKTLPSENAPINLVDDAIFFDDLPKTKQQGKYKYGFPQGALIHYTAGVVADGRRCVEKQLRNKHCYFVLDGQGKVFQQFDLDKWGWHAGKGTHKKLSSNVSAQLVGIEVMNPGRLEKIEEGVYKSWWGKKFYDADGVEFWEEQGNIKPGYYIPFNKSQIASLFNLLLNLKRMNEKVFRFNLVLGHDELKNSKSDPGGALGMMMSELRQQLKDEFKIQESGQQTLEDKLRQV